MLRTNPIVPRFCLQVSQSPAFPQQEPPKQPIPKQVQVSLEVSFITPNWSLFHQSFITLMLIPPTCCLPPSPLPPGLVPAGTTLAPDPITSPVPGRVASPAPNLPPANLALAHRNPVAGLVLAPATASHAPRALPKWSWSTALAADRTRNPWVRNHAVARRRPLRTETRSEPNPPRARRLPWLRRAARNLLSLTRALAHALNPALALNPDPVPDPPPRTNPHVRVNFWTTHRYPAL